MIWYPSLNSSAYVAMSSADYSQKVEDHQSLLVLVKHIGSQLRAKQFNRTFDRISKLQYIRIPGQQRGVWLRFKKSYQIENNDWGDFQAHRKVLGLICIGKCTRDDQLAETLNGYEKVKNQYVSTLYNTRLIIFGLNEDGTAVKKTESVNVEGSTQKDVGGKENFGSSKIIPDSKNSNIKHGDNEQGVSYSGTSGGGGEKTRTNVAFYPTIEDCPDLEDNIRDFAASLFWVLESKRIDRSAEKMDKMPLLMTPFERKDLVGIDTEGR